MHDLGLKWGFMVMRDIDEKATAHGSTSPTANDLQLALDSMPLPFYLFAPVRGASGTPIDMAYVYVNSAAERLSGIPFQDLVGKTMVELYPSTRDNGLLANYLAVLTSGEPMTIPLRAFDDHGVRGDFNIVAYRVDGEVAAVVHDVTEQLAAQAGLTEAEQRYRQLAENSDAIGLNLSTDGTVVEILGEPLRWLGRTAEQMLGKTLSELLGSDEATRLRQALLAAGSMSGDILVRGADGRQRWVAHQSRTVIDESGTVTGIISTWRDAQGEVELRQELDEAAQKARNLADLYEIARSEAVGAVEAKSAFLSEMSHELRTPLNIILGFAQLLEMDGLSADQRNSLSQITEAAYAQLTLIDDIRDLTRLERGTVSLSIEPVGVAEILAQVVDQMTMPAGTANVTLATPQDADPNLWIRADRQRVIQILVRIVGNGIRYSGAGGQVTATCQERGETVAISVSDTGPGVDASAMDGLFNPFNRTDINRGESHAMGIGLAVAQGLAHAMRGSIEVESASGQGATFTLVLPKGNKDRRINVDGSHDPTTGANLTVVYIEDNPANALLLTKITQLRANVTCLVAPTGLEGLALVASVRPGLVFLDLHLPDIDGEECLRRLRADPATRDLPVVIATADATTSIHRHLIDLGATGTMTKPLFVADVLAWLDDPTGSHRDAPQPDTAGPGDP